MIALNRVDSHRSSVVRCMLTALLTALLGATVASGQRGYPPGMGPGRGGVGAGAGDQQAVAAEKQVEGIAELLLKDYVAACRQLASKDIGEIQLILGQTKNYQARFSKENRARVYMIEAWAAHYGANGTDAVAKAKQGYDIAPHDLDVSDTLITLALAHGQYDVAKTVLAKRGAGKLVAVPFKGGNLAAQDLNGTGAGSDPNTGVAGPTVVAGQVGGARPDSPWSRAGGRPGRGGRGGNWAGPGGAMPPGGMPGAAPGMRPGMGAGRGMRGGRQKSVLNLPVENMLFEDLGKPFTDVVLHCVNGSFYPFQAGRGQVLLALLWDMPGAPRPGGSKWGVGRGAQRGGAGMRGMEMPPGMGEPMMDRRARGRSGRGRKGQLSDAEDLVPEVALDLWANADAFRDLFREHALGRRVGFVGVSFMQSGAAYQQTLGVLTEAAWPWPTCLAAEPLNRSQWQWQGATVAMLLVDTKGTIRYAGPVGGYLPKMLLDAEVALAQPNTLAADLGGAVTAGAPSKQGAGRLLMGLLGGGMGGTGQGAAEKPSADPSAASGNSQDSSARKSNVQAARMLQTARVQKAITPISALNMCDEILERYGDSLEADEAKLMIKAILNQRPDLKKMRERQGK